MTEQNRTTKERVLDQCEAMIAYVANRGIVKEVPQDGILDLMDLPRAEQLNQPMSSLVKLHRTLARMVEPALPETIEAMHTWRYQNPGTLLWRVWRRLAPLHSVAMLLFITLVLTVSTVLLFYYSDSIKKVLLYYNGVCVDTTVLKGQLNELVNKALTDAGVAATTDAGIAAEQMCSDEHDDLILWFYVYFGLLGAFGAAYSSIYDSFNYIREGRYDLRLGSTYYVRIFLGMFSGILLAEPLAGYLAESAISAGLLAFVGGFSAQLVYRLLTKIVDSVENMFRPDRQRERYSIHEKAAVNAREAMLEDDAAKRADLAKIVKDSHTITDPALKAETLEKAVIDLLTGKPSVAVVDVPARPIGPSLSVQAERAALFAQLAEHLAPSMPDTVAMPATPVLQATEQALKSALAAPDDQAGLKAALGAAQAVDPITSLTRQAQKWLTVLDDRSLEVTLAQAATVAAHRFTQAQIAGWRRLAYGANAGTPLLVIGDVSPDDLAALPEDDPFGTLLRAQLTTGPKVDAAKRAVSEGDIDMLYALLKPGFPDRAGFDDGLNGFIDRLCAQRLARDLQSVVTPRLSGSPAVTAIIAGLDQVRLNADLMAGLQQLELIGGTLGQTNAPDKAEAALLDLIASVETQEGA